MLTKLKRAIHDSSAPSSHRAYAPDIRSPRIGRFRGALAFISPTRTCDGMSAGCASMASHQSQQPPQRSFIDSTASCSRIPRLRWPLQLPSPFSECSCGPSPVWTRPPLFCQPSSHTYPPSQAQADSVDHPRAPLNLRILQMCLAPFVRRASALLRTGVFRESPTGIPSSLRSLASSGRASRVRLCPDRIDLGQSRMRPSKPSFPVLGHCQT